MGKSSVMREMPKAHRYLMQDIFLAYLAMGIYLTLIGSALPSIKAEYHISYQVGGWMMSAQQIGYLAMGIVVSLATRRLGAKCTYLFLGAWSPIPLPSRAAARGRCQTGCRRPHRRTAERRH